MIWNNVSFKLAIYQKLVDRIIDHDCFFLQAPRRVLFIWRVTPFLRVPKKCMNLSQIWVGTSTWVTLNMQDDSTTNGHPTCVR